MLAPQSGNMADVYRELESIAVARSAEVAMADYLRRAGVLEAEITSDGVKGAWLLIRTLAGGEHTASHHLIRRRFGVYQPRYKKTYKLKHPKTGKEYSCTRHFSLFPSYIFVYVWGIEEHWRRICNCPGVHTITVRADKPLILSDAFIDRIQVMEAVEDGLTQSKRHKRRRRRRGTDEPSPDDEQGGELVISTRSFLDLEPEQRISALHKALGLSS